EGHGKKAAAHAEEQGLNAGECERNAQLDAGALAQGAGDVDGALEAVEDGAHNVHADAAAGDFGDLGSGAETGLENEIEDVLRVEALSVFGFQQAVVNGLVANEVEIDAAAIVADFDDHLCALMIGIEKNGAASGLSRIEALAGRLDAVIDGVADEVGEGFSKGVEYALVEIGVLAGHFEGDVFATELGDIADDAREAAEELLDGHHADFQNALVQFVEDAGLKGWASASLTRTGSRESCASNSARVRLSMDLPMINSPTRFMTASMRAASTRKVASATAATAETGDCFAAADSAGSAARVAACASTISPRSSCSADSARLAGSMRKSETTEGMRQRWATCSIGWAKAMAAWTTSTEAPASLSSGRRAMTLPQACRTLRTSWKAAARMALLGSRRMAMLETLSPRRSASE